MSTVLIVNAYLVFNFRAVVYLNVSAVAIAPRSMSNHQAPGSRSNLRFKPKFQITLKFFVFCIAKSNFCVETLSLEFRLKITDRNTSSKITEVFTEA